MSKMLIEQIQPVTAIGSRAFTGAATTANGRPILLSNARKVLLRYVLGAVALTDSAYTLSALEASDELGATARNIGNAAVTPNVVIGPAAAGCIPNANVVTLTCNTVLAGEKVTINGVEFEAVNGATVLANNQYDMRGNDTADAGELVSVINNALPDLVATNAGAVVTVQSRVPGATTVTVDGITDTATLIPATVEAVAYIEVDASQLSNGYDRVVARALTGAVAAASTLSVVAILGDGRYLPVTVQAAGIA